MVSYWQAMTEKQAKDLREQREGRRIDVEAGNDRCVFTYAMCGYPFHSSDWSSFAGSRTALIFSC